MSQVESVLALPVLGAALKLLLLVVLLQLFRRGLTLAVRAMERRVAGQVLDIDRRRRLDTLLRAGEATATVVVVMIVLITARRDK